VRLFLDTSVLLAACASASGASREVFLLAPANGWVLIATPYIVAEVTRNLPDFTFAATTEWLRLRGQLLILDDVLTLDRPVVFPAGKDRPILKHFKINDSQGPKARNRPAQGNALGKRDRKWQAPTGRNNRCGHGFI
jgi:hypothetical protein